ncbi:S-adenosylmethionine decarboxylase related protein [Paenibacillus solisilvae]|uniref:S-adenosylmethionine decarboxylase related protein n=1 Tax=Paenibacillus solisilvae TaxID=2486751 RepID=A0ABW0W4E5_9BACL
MENPNDPISITILGSGGGVAKAFLAFLNHSAQDESDPLMSIISRARLHLVDYRQKTEEYYSQVCPGLMPQITLYQLDLAQVEDFEALLVLTGTSLVVDVSLAGTIEMHSCCDRLGISYMNTALTDTLVDEGEQNYGFPPIERYLRLEAHKGSFNNAKAIIGTGMNPGVVQWMAIHLMELNPQDKPLACYIVEHDTSFLADPGSVDPNTLYTTWSTESFLDEAVSCYPMFVHHHIPLCMYEQVYASEYKVSLGDKQFYGSLMAHEEVLTLGHLYDMEIGFLYRINEHTTELIRSNLNDASKLWDLNSQIITPARQEVSGEDLVGVLLVYDGYETYMYNTVKSSDTFVQYQTNATYFQVACGLYASLASLLLDPIPPGSYYVDELLLQTESRYEQYLTRHMKDFVIGRNETSDGLLYQRRRLMDK